MSIFTKIIFWMLFLISNSYHFGHIQDEGLKSISPLTVSNDVGFDLIFTNGFLYI